MTFADLGLSEDILKAVADAGYDTPTPIQRQAIPSVMMARDILGCAQTGTGKTASFVLPMLDILHHGRARMRMPRSIILEPTRELATQVAHNFDTYGKYVPLSKALVIGGESFVEQQKILEKGADVIIATPGRLIDTFERGKLLLSDCKLLVIDEADRMLDMGFIPDIEKIVNMLPKQRQTLFFSATMPKEIRRLADKFLSNPKEITVAPPSSMATTVEHKLLVIDEMDKRETLRRLIRAEDVKNAFVFCNRKKDVDILYKSLTKHGFNAGRMHGDLVQSERTETLDKFKSGDITVLICSDVAARGIDVADVSHVFNFDVPFNAEDYVHRTGRTGRAGRDGKAFTLATPEDGKLVEAINKTINMSIPMTAVEGIETLELDFSGKKRRNKRNNRDKGRDRDRGERGDRGDRNGRNNARRSASQDQEAAANVAASPAKEAPKPAERPAAPAKREQQNNAATGNNTAPIRHVRDPREERHQNRPQRDRKNHNRRDRDDYDDKPVIGMGDHVPAFMLTAVPQSSLRKPAAPEKEEVETKPAKKTGRKPANRKAAAPRKSRKPAPADKADDSAKAAASDVKPAHEAPAKLAPVKAEAEAPAKAETVAVAAAPAPEAQSTVESPVAAAKPVEAEAKVEAEAVVPAAAETEAKADGGAEAKPAKAKTTRAPRKPRAKAATKTKAASKTAPAEGDEGKADAEGEAAKPKKAAAKKPAKPRAPRKPRKKAEPAEGEATAASSPDSPAASAE
ncbi:DEAD/DEAH box helicase [Thalassospira marina]|uniref:DEAD/DEAH box helicase n=1 Tax=Thalassospira marina TaxID=2048283 RepID=A0ABM6Q7N5_9PROT|nr:DEAD/DEAH box helicase [Thalassospira marina]AUG52549.1 DEAD/DEAH box helicase [Thalassospira marina]